MLRIPKHHTLALPGKGEDREKRGWYWLDEILLDEDDGARAPYIVGAYGVYHGLDNGKQKVLLNRDGKRAKLDRSQREALNKRLADNAKRMKAMRQAEAEKAGRRAAAAWRTYLPTGESAYLEKKGVEAHGVRFSPSGNGTLAIPMTDQAGRIWGLQIIRPNPKKHQPSKQYWPKGISKVGRYHLIGGTPRGLVLIAEGYATAASIHQATGLPVAVAFDAVSLVSVASALSDAYTGIKILICADDDYRTEGNPGIKKADEAVLAVGGKRLAPVFDHPRAEDGPKGPTDFNDLHQIEGLHVVRAQISGFLDSIGWSGAGSSQPARNLYTEGAGEGGYMPSRLTIDEASQRYWGTYGLGGKVLFDEVERRLVHQDDVGNLLGRSGLNDLRAHPDWRVARDTEIGFDPAGKDKNIRCNLFGGWPTEPKEGSCEQSLELLQFLCSAESNGADVYQWLLKWLAYPIQCPGAKMHTAIVLHGPQGTGKSLVFEAIVKIYGEYGRVLGQEALEDKFNADWAEKKLFILADEILAKSEMYHIKNRLKGFITGDTIRVNPKNIGAHNEQNHMNIVFLSNERQPLVLENDDRRHKVIWTPPKLDSGIYEDVAAELNNGGVEALHHYLLNLDLGDFKPWTRPIMTESKQDLINLGLSSEERFVREWKAGEIETRNGNPLPFCPCLGSHLYKEYERYCGENGEFRPRPANHFINFLAKQHGWTAGKPQNTWVSFQDTRNRSRKIVIPSDGVMQEAASSAPADSEQAKLVRGQEESKIEWLTRGYFAFAMATDLI